MLPVSCILTPAQLVIPPEVTGVLCNFTILNLKGRMRAFTSSYWPCSLSYLLYTFTLAMDISNNFRLNSYDFSRWSTRSSCALLWCCRLNVFGNLSSAAASSLGWLTYSFLLDTPTNYFSAIPATVDIIFISFVLEFCAASSRRCCLSVIQNVSIQESLKFLLDRRFYFSLSFVGLLVPRFHTPFRCFHHAFHRVVLINLRHAQLYIVSEVF